MISKRQKHWATRAYHEFLRVRARAAFVWGKSDCALFAADGILAVTGVDIADDFRGKYATEAEAMALIKSVCNGATVADAAVYCAQKHGLEEWVDKKGKPRPLMARRGDLVVFNAPTGSMVAGPRASLRTDRRAGRKRCLPLSDIEGFEGLAL